MQVKHVWAEPGEEKAHALGLYRIKKEKIDTILVIKIVSSSSRVSLDGTGAAMISS